MGSAPLGHRTGPQAKPSFRPSVNMVPAKDHGGLMVSHLQDGRFEVETPSGKSSGAPHRAAGGEGPASRARCQLAVELPGLIRMVPSARRIMIRWSRPGA